MFIFQIAFWTFLTLRKAIVQGLEKAYQFVDWWAFSLYSYVCGWLLVSWTIRPGLPPFLDPYILRIDLLCQERDGQPLTSVYPWTSEDLALIRLIANNKFLIAYDGPRPIGFLFYTVEHRYFHIEKIAVHPHYRRLGVATDLLWRLYLSLDEYHPAMELWVREYNDEAVKFLSKGVQDKMGLALNCELVKDSYSDTHEDGIVFRIGRGCYVENYNSWAE